MHAAEDFESIKIYGVIPWAERSCIIGSSLEDFLKLVDINTPFPKSQPDFGSEYTCCSSALLLLNEIRTVQSDEGDGL